VSDFFNPSGSACCSAIGMYSWQDGNIGGVIEDCAVELNGERGWGFGGEFAFNVSRGKGVTIRRCRSRGAQRGFNNDTNPNQNVILADNYFDLPAGVSYGALLEYPNPGSQFLRNTIIVRGAGSAAFPVTRDPSGNKLLFAGNRVIAAGSWAGASAGFDIPEIATQIELRDNATLGTPAARINNLVAASNGMMKGNTQDGTPWLWPVQQPNEGWEFGGVV
jgi:hypothetical protein